MLAPVTLATVFLGQLRFGQRVGGHHRLRGVEWFFGGGVAIGTERDVIIAQKLDRRDRLRGNVFGAGVADHRALLQGAVGHRVGRVRANSVFRPRDDGGPNRKKPGTSQKVIESVPEKPGICRDDLALE